MAAKPKHIIREWTVGEYTGKYKDSITHVYIGKELVAEYNHCHKMYTYLRPKTQLPAYVVTEIKISV